MTTGLAVNSDNDLFLDATGNIAMASGLYSVEQAAEHAMKTVLAECIFDQQRGIPYFQAVWSGQPSLQQFNFAGISAIQEVDGVLTVSDFQSTLSGESLVYSATIETAYGIGKVSQQ